MILVKCNVQPEHNLIDAEGCPYCGEKPREISVNDPADINLQCGHVVDATRWID